MSVLSLSNISQSVPHIMTEKLLAIKLAYITPHMVWKNYATVTLCTL